MLPPTRRLPSVGELVAEQLYFVVHASRQSGKTTAMRALSEVLRDQGYVALHLSLEMAQGVESANEAEPIWLRALEAAAAVDLPVESRPPSPDPDAPTGTRVHGTLRAWSEAQYPKKIVLFLDEADVVSGPALVSLLRQLRAGFPTRPTAFPSSVALVGMRELRDYLTHSKDGVAVNPGSPFNIKAASLTLRNFTEEEVAELYGQHTADTGQTFQLSATARAFYWSQGHPFLVNALARIAVMDLVPDRSVPVTAAHIDEAKEQLILSRTTHLYALSERLKEPRVARIIQAVLLGDERIPYDHDDYQYTIDLGLVADDRGGARIANPLYREVLARQISYNTQRNLPAPQWRWATPDGGLDFAALLSEFRQYWRENADMLAEYDGGYPEAVPHITFMAFLQRVVNGGGRVEREFAAGRGAIDLVAYYNSERFVVELKRVRSRDSLETVRAKGIVQLSAYLDTLGMTEGWLLIFDTRAGKTWDERLWSEEICVEGKLLHLCGA